MTIIVPKDHDDMLRILADLQEAGFDLGQVRTVTDTPYMGLDVHPDWAAAIGFGPDGDAEPEEDDGGEDVDDNGDKRAPEDPDGSDGKQDPDGKQKQEPDDGAAGAPPAAGGKKSTAPKKTTSPPAPSGDTAKKG